MGTAQTPVDVPPGASLVADRRQGMRQRFTRRGGGVYLPLAERNALAIASGLV
jgi:hypothetical protein